MHTRFPGKLPLWAGVLESIHFRVGEQDNGRVVGYGNRSAVSRDVKALRERRLVMLTRTVNRGHGIVTLSARAKHVELRAQL
jgi:hypothetical protein